MTGVATRLEEWKFSWVVIRDHRNTERPLASFGARWRSARQRAEFPDAEFRSVRDRVRARCGEGAAGMRERAITATWVAWFTFAAWQARFGSWDRMVIPGLMTATTAFYALTARHRLPPLAPTSIVVEELLAGRRCAACAHSLLAAAVEADGCTVCPECGAAWRLA